MDTQVELILSSIKRKVELMIEKKNEFEFDFEREIGILDTLSRQGKFESEKLNDLRNKINLIEKFITSLGIGLATSNVIDRHFYNIESYVSTDIMIVLCVFLVSFYDFKRLNKLAKIHNGKNDTK